MITMNYISEKILSVILDKISAQLDNGLINKMRPELQYMDTKLNGILNRKTDLAQRRIERVLIRDLRTALNHLAMGELSQARDCLIEAEADGFPSPVVKFWLSLLYNHDGKKELAIEKLERALSFNPFTIFVCMPPVANHVTLLLSEFTDLKSEEIKMAHSIGIQWERTVRLAEIFSEKRYGSALIESILPEKNMDWLAIEAVSTAEEQIFVAWIAGGSDPLVKRKCISSHSVDNGNTMWTREINRSISHPLVLSSTDYLVVKGMESSSEYELWRTDSGESMYEFDEEIFETLYCPNYTTLKEIKYYQKSHCNMEHPEYMVKIHKDERTISDPLGLQMFNIKIVNQWDIEKFSKTNISVMTDGMWDSEIESWSTHCSSRIIREY